MDTIPNTTITTDDFATALAGQLAKLVAAEPARYAGVATWDALHDIYDGLLTDTEVALGYDFDSADEGDWDGYKAVVVPAIDLVVAAHFPL